MTTRTVYVVAPRDVTPEELVDFELWGDRTMAHEVAYGNGEVVYVATVTLSASDIRPDEESA